MGGKLTGWNGLVYAANGQGLRRLYFDGSLDPTFDMVNAPYFAVFQGGDYHVYPDGRILLSGAHEVNYPDSSWVGYYNLIWFTNEGYLDTTRTPRIGDGTIDYFRELPDGKFICTGAMSQFEGQPTTSIFRVGADGQLDPTFNANVTWGQAFGFLPLADGRCYASGAFIQNNSTDTLQLVRFMPDGSLDPTFNNHMRFGITAPFFNFMTLGSVDRIHALDAGRLIVTGQFRDVDGQPRGSICLVDTAGNLLDDYFADAACGPHSYMGLTLAAIAGIIGDSASYIWGDYHGYNDGTTNDPLQRFVTRLYGPDYGMGVATWPQVEKASLSIAPNPATTWIAIF
ncbi:MAG: delta-60 repeat domain-containing protein [Flavobacteriales bacterium]|nr:delta-60 repeat domain-containing protein [Flavobacteriales bacterium]